MDLDDEEDGYLDATASRHGWYSGDNGFASDFEDDPAAPAPGSSGDSGDGDVDVAARYRSALGSGGGAGRSGGSGGSRDAW